MAKQTCNNCYWCKAKEKHAFIPVVNAVASYMEYECHALPQPVKKELHDTCSLWKDHEWESNTYHVTKKTYVGAFGGKDWIRNSSELLPNFFGLIKKYGYSTLGFSFLVPDSNVAHQDQIIRGLEGLGINEYVLNLHSDDTTYYFGPSYAYWLSEKFSVGLTFYYMYRKSFHNIFPLIDVCK